MVKKHTTINVDHKVLEKAKQLNMNVSEVAEKAIKAKAGIVEVDTQVLACEFCGKEMEKAVASTHEKGLVWLNPDLKWWCQRCHPK